MGFSSLDVDSYAKIIFPEFAQVSQFAGQPETATPRMINARFPPFLRH